MSTRENFWNVYCFVTNNQWPMTNMKPQKVTTKPQHGLVTTFLVYYEFGNEIKWPVLVYYGKKWHVFRENHRVYKKDVYANTKEYFTGKFFSGLTASITSWAGESNVVLGVMLCVPARKEGKTKLCDTFLFTFFKQEQS